MNGSKSTMNKIAESPFFTFSRPALDFIEKAKLFKIAFVLVCIAMAVVNIVFPFVILARVISSGYFNFGVKYVLAFILTWLAVIAACWLGFHLWWDRRKKSTEIGSSEFIVTPFFAEILRTFGEWLGIMLGIIGAIGGLFALIFLGRYSGGMLSATLLGMGFGGLPGSGILSIIFSAAVILGPLAGFFIIFVSRFFAEQIRVFAAIANNTKKEK